MRQRLDRAVEPPEGKIGRRQQALQIPFEAQGRSGRQGLPARRRGSRRLTDVTSGPARSRCPRRRLGLGDGSLSHGPRQDLVIKAAFSMAASEQPQERHASRSGSAPLPVFFGSPIVVGGHVDREPVVDLSRRTALRAAVEPALDVESAARRIDDDTERYQSSVGGECPTVTQGACSRDCSCIVGRPRAAGMFSDQAATRAATTRAHIADSGTLIGARGWCGAKP